jgi:hypothetical protein
MSAVRCIHLKLGLSLGRTRRGDNVRPFAMLLLLGATVLCPSLLADTFTFLDLDMSAVQIQASNPSRLANVVMQAQSAAFDLLSPSPNAVPIGETITQGLPHLNIGEITSTCGPTGLVAGCESDTLSVSPFAHTVGLLFFSDATDSFPCAAEIRCQITEDGTVQMAGTITWNDGTVDSIRFQSLEPVPEPSYLIVLLTALGCAIYCRRFATTQRGGPRNTQNRGLSLK